MTHELQSLTQLGWSNHFQSQLELDQIGTHLPARIREVHRNSVETITESGPVLVAMTPELAEARVAVGDWLLIDPDGAGRLLDRKSQITRKAAGHVHMSQAIAANVDTVFVVTSCNADFNLARLERYLVLARQAEVDPVIILTKPDLAEDADDFLHRAQKGLPGVLVECLVAKDEDAVSQILGPWCKSGQTVALLGSSGVGKTTLTNALTGGMDKTQDIRESDGKGRHTTTSRSMHEMRAGGWLIDTPGMRELQLHDMAEGIDAVFDDLAQIAENCKFHDCAHASEPGCAIQAAIEAGEIDEDRLARWQKLQREDQYNSETVAQQHERFRKREKMYSQGKARSKHKRRGFD